MSEAEWTATEESELARERREGFVLSKEFFRRAKGQTVTVFVLMSLLGVSFWGARIDTIFFALAILSLGSIPLALHWENRQEARHEADPEMQAALGHDGQLVSIIFRQGDAPTGEDEGMLWFEDGRLYFSGRRTSFGLVPQQARGFATIEEAAANVRHRLTLVLQREGTVGPMALSFAPLVSNLSNPDVAVGALRAKLDRWTEGRASGEGQWPPAGLGPCVVLERKLLARALRATLVYPVVPAIFLLLFSAPTVALVAFFLGMIVFTFAPANALVWRAWWSRRRLRRLDERR